MYKGENSDGRWCSIVLKKFITSSDLNTSDYLKNSIVHFTIKFITKASVLTLTTFDFSHSNSVQTK